MAGDAGTELSRGGMVTKIEAAKIALGAGTNMVITSRQGRCIRCARSARARRAPGSSRPPIRVTARKRWIAGQLEPKGYVVRRCRAPRRRSPPARACCRPASPRVEGTFERGDAVVIRAADGRELGRGLDRLCEGRCRAYHRQEERRDRRHPRATTAAPS